MNERNTWIDIITKLYRDLHTSPRVMHTANESDKKRDRVLNYFERLERVHDKVANSKDKAAEKLLKKFYYDLYVIKEENIPDSYFEHEKQIMRERGYGDIEITPERREILVNQIIEDQRESLDKWIEYFLYDEESKHYEMWEKYWVFQGLQNLGKYDKEKGKFSKRDKHTVYPFPPVDREAVFTTLKLMEDYIKDKKGEDEIRSALGSGNFKTLYEYSLKMIMQQGEKKNNETDGVWIKYDQGSDYNKLRDSLQGYYTGWCTAAGENFAKEQLANGDFYVYYTYDEENSPKVPRIAIRMNGHNEIAEIRGIAKNQNMEPEMMPILNKKLEEFPDKEKYLKKEYDMQLLTTIDNKVNKGYELSLEELKFLYEIDIKIEGFGYAKDPRIEEIKSKRNQKQDFAKIFNCNEDEIYIGKIKDNNINELEGKTVIVGNLDLSGLRSAEGLTLPQRVGGYLNLRRLTSAKGLVLPQSIGGKLDLRGLTSTGDLVLPQSVGGNLDLRSLTSVGDLVLPQSVGGYLDLGSLTSAEDLVLPQSVGGNLDLRSLTSAEGLTLPQSVGGNLDLRSLTSAESLILPENIGGDLDLSGLTSDESLIFPESIGGYISLYNLTSVKSLIFRSDILKSLYLRSLTTVEELTLPKIVLKSVDLRSLTSVEGLTLPENVGGDLDLRGLTSAEGLTLPENIGGDLDLSGLTSAEGLVLPRFIVGKLDLSGLKSNKGLKLPKGFPLDNLIISRDVSADLTSKNAEIQDNKMQDIEEKEMQFLTQINDKVQNKIELTAEEVNHLYKIDIEKNNSFSVSYKNKSEILKEIKSKRNVKQDLAQVFNCKPEEIIIGKITEQNIDDISEIKLCYGDVDLGTLEEVNDLILPKFVSGNVFLEEAYVAENLELPEYVGGNVFLENLLNASKIKYPKHIEHSLYLERLNKFSDMDIELPQSIGENLDLSSLTSAEDLTLPQSIGGDLDLRSLTSVEDIALPQNVDGIIYLNSLESAKGLKLPKGFPLKKLYVADKVMAEIIANPELYYQTDELETVKENEQGRSR